MNLTDNQMTEVGLDFLDYEDFKTYQQVKIGNYGICDLIFAKRIPYQIGIAGSFLSIYAVELKKDNLSMSAYIQLNRYMAGIKYYFYKKGIDIKLTGVLIGRGFDLQNDFCYVSNISSIKFYSYTYDWNGIKFNEDYGYHLINHGFERRLKNEA